MRLFIAEKPSLARAIADALPGPQTKRRGSIECGGDDVVAWCAGHILELAEPEQYAPEYKTWRLEHLPIVPTHQRYRHTNLGSVPNAIRYRSKVSLSPRVRSGNTRDMCSFT